MKPSRPIPTNLNHLGFNDSVPKNFQIKPRILQFECLLVDFSEDFHERKQVGWKHLSIRIANLWFQRHLYIT